jgi:hypothetical protein
MQYLFEYKFLSILFGKLLFKLKSRFRNCPIGWFPPHFCNAFKIGTIQHLVMDITQLVLLEYNPAK